MCLFSVAGDFLYSRNKGMVILTKSKRKRAKDLPCGRGPSLCWAHGLAYGIISDDLAFSLQDDPDFALPQPLTIEAATRWVAGPPNPATGSCN